MNIKLPSQLKTHGIKNSLILTSGNFISSAIAALTFIITSRVLSPSEFGNFSAHLAILLLFTRITDLGLNIAIQRQIARESSASIISKIITTGVLLKLISWVTLLILGSILAPYITTHFLQNISTPNLIIIFSLVAITLFFDLSMVIIQGLQKFTTNSLYSISLSFLKLIGILLFIFIGKTTSHNFFYIFAITPLIPTLLNLKNIRYSLNYNLADFKFHAKSLIQISKWTGLAMIAAAAADNFDIILIQTYLNNEQTGLYAAASRLAVFFSLFGMSIGTVLSIQVAKYKFSNQISLYLRKAHLFALLSIFGLILISFFSYWGIYLTSGQAYLPATPALAILLIATGFDIAASPFIALFYLYNHPRYYFYAGILLLITLITTNYILIPIYGINGAATAKLVTRLTLFVFTIFYTLQATKHHLKSS